MPTWYWFYFTMAGKVYVQSQAINNIQRKTEPLNSKIENIAGSDHGRQS